MSNARVPGLEIEDPAAYLRKMQRLIGDRDHLEILTRTPRLLADIVRSHTTTQFTTRPFEGKWTPNEILGHLVDIEWVFAFRIRHAVCDVDPAIEGFDQDRWVDRLGHNGIAPEAHLEAFSLLRPCNVEAWRILSPEDLQRTYRHQERGAETVETLRTLHAGHDLWHLEQITRYLDAAAIG